MKRLAMVAALLLAGCGGSEEEVAEARSPFERAPLCHGVPAHGGFMGVACCEAGATHMLNAITGEPVADCGVHVVMCENRVTHRLIGSEWVAESPAHGCE